MQCPNCGSKVAKDAELAKGSVGVCTGCGMAVETDEKKAEALAEEQAKVYAGVVDASQDVLEEVPEEPAP